MDNYPSNSHTEKSSLSRGASEQQPKVKKVVTGAVVRQKKPLLARLFGSNLSGVGDYIIWDVLLPAVKSTLLDMISNGAEMIFYGERGKKAGNIQRERGKSFISYSNYYARKEPEPRGRSHNRGSHSFDDIVFYERSDAERVLSTLADLIQDYGLARVSEFYEAADLAFDWSDHKFGWESLKDAKVQRIRNGYILDLPRPITLD